MRRALFLLLLVAAGGLGVGLHSLVAANTATPVRSPKWEYKVLDAFSLGKIARPDSDSLSEVARDEEHHKALGLLGEEGWELVAVTGTAEKEHTFYLRRMK
jgi:hypothetical protein